MGWIISAVVVAGKSSLLRTFIAATKSSHGISGRVLARIAPTKRQRNGEGRTLRTTFVEHVLVN
jgi:hypothetical protein